MPTNGDSEFLLFLQQDPFGKSCLESDTEASGNEYNSDASSNFEDEEAAGDAGLDLAIADGLVAIGDEGLDPSHDPSQEAINAPRNGEPQEAEVSRLQNPYASPEKGPATTSDAQIVSVAEGEAIEAPRNGKPQEAEVSRLQNPHASPEKDPAAPSDAQIVSVAEGEAIEAPRNGEPQESEVSRLQNPHASPEKNPAAPSDAQIVQSEHGHVRNLFTAILKGNVPGETWVLAQELEGGKVWVKEVKKERQAAQVPESIPWHMPREGDTVVKVNSAGFESKNPQQLVSYIEQERNSRGCVDVTLERPGASGNLLFIVRLNRPMLEAAREHLGLEIRPTRDQTARSGPEVELTGTVMNKKLHEMSVKMLGPVSGSDQGRSNPFPASPSSSVKSLPGSSTEGWHPRLSGTYPVGRGNDSAAGSSEAGMVFLTPTKLGAHDRLSNSAGHSPASSLYSTLERVPGTDYLTSPKSESILSPIRGEPVDDFLSSRSVRRSTAPSSPFSGTNSSQRFEAGTSPTQLNSTYSSQPLVSMHRKSDFDASEILRMAVEDVEFYRRRAAEDGGGSGVEGGEDLDSSVMSEQEHQVAVEAARERMYQETRQLYENEVTQAIRRQSLQQTTPLLEQLKGASSEVLHGSPARFVGSTSPSRSPQSSEHAPVETLIT